MVSLRSWLEHLRSSGLTARDSRIHNVGWGVGRPTRGPGLAETARPTAVDQASVPRDPHTPARGLEPQRRRAPFKPGRGGSLGPELVRSGHLRNWGPGLRGTSRPRCLPEDPITALPPFPFCLATLTRIYRQQRRHVGSALTEPSAAQKPQESVRLPVAPPEQKDTTLPTRNCTLDRRRRVQLFKNLLWVTYVHFRQD